MEKKGQVLFVSNVDTLITLGLHVEKKGQVFFVSNVDTLITLGLHVKKKGQVIQPLTTFKSPNLLTFSLAKSSFKKMVIK